MPAIGSSSGSAVRLPGPRRSPACHRPAGDEQDVGVERSGQRLVEPAGVQLGRARAEPLDDDDIGSVMDRLPGSDDLLEHDVESARSELLLQLGGGRADPGDAAR